METSSNSALTFKWGESTVSEEQPRNAQAGQRQKQLEKQRRQASGRAFSDANLTRKNEDFMYQLNKQLDRLGVSSDKKDAMLNETIQKLLAGQENGRTARTLLGTPTEYAKELKNPKPTPAETNRQSIRLLAIDNMLIFLSIFTFMFGLMFWLSPAAMQTKQAGTSGITAILIVALTGGLIFGYVATQVQPQFNAKGKRVNKKPLWQRILVIVAGLAAWLLIYMLVSLLPNAINPRLNPFVYLGIGVLTFLGDMYFRARFHVSGSLYGRRPNQQK